MPARAYLEAATIISPALVVIWTAVAVSVELISVEAVVPVELDRNRGGAFDRNRCRLHVGTVISGPRGSEGVHRSEAGSESYYRRRCARRKPQFS